MLLSNSRNQNIDLLRGIAILLVLILHFHLAYHFDQNFLAIIARNGNYGVTMFFVISGFLITTAALERYGKLKNADLLGFYIMRFARIMPCLLLLLLMVLTFTFAKIPIFADKANAPSLWMTVLSVLTFWHNVLMAKFGYFNYGLNICWSLSVEEVFYFTFPILCLLFKRTRSLIFLWLILIIAAPIYRSFHADDKIIAMYGYFSCFDGIAIGCCVAILLNSAKFKKWHAKIAPQFNTAIQYLTILLLVVVYFYADVEKNMTYGFTLMAIGTAILIITSSAKKHTSNYHRNQLKQAIGWFGKNSYELYLFHIPVLGLMRTIPTNHILGAYSKLCWMLVFFLSTAMLAKTIANCYSQPLNKFLRQQLFAWRKKPNVIIEIPQIDTAGLKLPE